MKVTLRPCPFCGSRAELLKYEDEGCIVFKVQCSSVYECGINRGEFGLKKHAIESWNRRVKLEAT